MARHRVVLLFTAFCAAGAILSLPGVAYTEHAPSALSHDREVRVKFSGDSLVPVVPVSFEMEERLFVLDTGATMSVIDRRFRVKLGVPKRACTVNTGVGRTKMEVFKAPIALISGVLPAGVDEVLCWDLSRLRDTAGADFYGVLGMDFLRQYVVRLDFDRGEIAVLKCVPDDAGDPVALGVWLRKPPTITLAVADAGEAEFFVDSGSNGNGTIGSRLRASLLKMGTPVPPGVSAFETALGSRTSSEILIPKISLGRFHHRRMVFAEGENNMLGLGYLSRFVLTFDFPRRKLYLKRGQHYDAPTIRDFGGPGVWRPNGRTTISDVEQNSAADFAGLHVDDVIETIDDKDAGSLALWEVRRLLCTPGVHRLRIMRGDKTVRAALAIAAPEIE